MAPIGRALSVGIASLALLASGCTKAGPRSVGGSEPLPTAGGGGISARLSIASDCSITIASNTCDPTQVRVVSGLLEFELPCTVGELFTDTKGQAGTCSIESGTKRPAVFSARVSGNCLGGFSIRSKGPPSPGRFLDQNGVAWIIESLILGADTHVYEPAEGTDLWAINRVTSRLVLNRTGAPPRKHTLLLTGKIRSTSRCAHGIEARNFTAEIAADPGPPV